jgi:hypothetical protein
MAPVRIDVEKSSSHHLSQDEVAGDNPFSQHLSEGQYPGSALIMTQRGPKLIGSTRDPVPNVHALIKLERMRAGVRRNSPEFRELHDQTQNSIRPYPHHCASKPFARMSTYSGESTIVEIAEEAAAMQRTRRSTTLVSDGEPAGAINGPFEVNNADLRHIWAM